LASSLGHPHRSSAPGPKSRILGWPPSSTRILPGFRSRWMTPRRWACSTAFAYLDHQPQAVDALSKLVVGGVAVERQPLDEFHPRSKGCDSPSRSPPRLLHRPGQFRGGGRRARAPRLAVKPLEHIGGQEGRFRMTLRATIRRGCSCSASNTEPIPPSPSNRNDAISVRSSPASPAVDSIPVVSRHTPQSSPSVRGSLQVEHCLVNV